MGALPISQGANGPAAEWHARFLAMLPAIQGFAVRSFSRLPVCEREELVAEAVAAALAMFCRLVERDRADLAFATPLARYACRHVRQGRRLGTPLNVNDVSSPYCRRRKNVRVESLHRLERGAWREAVIEDHRTPVAEQAAFRCDFPAWLRTLPRRNRRIAEALSTGEPTSRVARIFRLSAARVSQLRRELELAWGRFHGECETAAAGCVA